MSISSQLPPISLAHASAGLRALAQAAGQTVEARVLSQSSNGSTQVQIGRQVLSLALPEGQPVGTTLTLSVQQADGQLRLTVVASKPPAAPSLASPQANSVPAPATSVHLSAAALSGSPPAQAMAPTPVGQGFQAGPAPVAPAPVNQAVAPAPSAPPTAVSQGSAAPSQTSGAVPAAAAAPARANSPPTSSLPSPVTVAAVGSTPAVTASPAAGNNGPVAVPPALAPAAAVPGAVAPTSGGQPAAIPAPVSMPAASAAPTGVAASSVTVPATATPLRADIPYAVAAPMSGSSQVTGVTGSAATALPPVAQTVASGMTGQHAPTPNFQGGTAPSSTASAPPAPVVPAPMPSTPQAALSQMMHQALPRQDSIVGLTTALAAIVGKVALPEPVAKAAQQVLAARVSLDGGIGGAALKAAMQKSGVFQEALLASGQGQAAAGDTKSALLGLRQSLGQWLGNQAPIAQLSGVAPPLRGQIPRARAGDGLTPDLPDDPLEISKLLMDRTDSALSRLRLHQSASLPDPNSPRPDTQWSLDLPVVVAGQQHLLQMQIHRDAEKDAERPEDRGWQVRFAINLAERGEVGAQISLRARNAGVLLWADHAETAQALAEAVDDLRDAIFNVGLIPGAIVVRTGAPAAQNSQPVGQAGHYVDATR